MHSSEQNKHLLLILLLALVAIISWFPYMNSLFPHLSYGDEGVIVQGAYRVFNGQIPYKDFFSIMAPGAYYWTAILFSIFGPTFFAVRLGTLLIAATILIVTCLVIRSCGARSTISYILVAIFLIHFGGPYWFIASHHWLALCFSLLSLLLLSKAQNATSSIYIILSGSFAAATA